MRDVHSMEIRWKLHAVERLSQRFKLDPDDAEHLLKTGKLIKKIEKEGQIGIIENKKKKSIIRFKFLIYKKMLWVITVEGGKK
jgi:hypothetical protein